MTSEIIRGILIPFAGTSLGAAMVFFMKTSLNEQVSRALTGFAAGVMVAASIWSLLLPAMEQAADMGQLSVSGSVFYFCCCSITSSRIYTGTATRQRDPEAT